MVIISKIERIRDLESSLYCNTGKNVQQKNFQAEQFLRIFL
uniref:Uncharacterized protein n=1 Tax=Cryptosporidium parvum TaxID=5807 RepID=F0X5Z4_CRYPV